MFNPLFKHPVRLLVFTFCVLYFVALHVNAIATVYCWKHKKVPTFANFYAPQPQQEVQQISYNSDGMNALLDKALKDNEQREEAQAQAEINRHPPYKVARSR